MQPLTTKKVKVALTDVPKGINTISILDSLNMPLAERDFFSAYNSTIKPEIVIPKIAYDKKEKVNVKQILKDDKGDPIQGIVSIDCIQGNRISENITGMHICFIYSFHINSLGFGDLQTKINIPTQNVSSY